MSSTSSSSSYIENWSSSSSSYIENWSSSSSSSTSYIENWSSSSSSSTSSFSTSSESQESPKFGVTYYSEFRNVNDINNPIIDNDVKMQYTGFLEQDWNNDDLAFDTFGYGLKKTTSNKGSIFCNDASRLFSMNEGYVEMVLNLPYSITNGVYQRTTNTNLEITDYILWGSNIGETGNSQPGLIALLTPSGISFTISTSDGTHAIIDTTTDISANTDFNIKFIWESHGLDTTYATMKIIVNDIVTATGNPPIENNPITNSNFYALDTSYGKSNLECTIRKLLIKNVADITDTIITHKFTPLEGVGVISVSGLQKFPNDLDSYSQVFASIYSATSVKKTAIDNCWESGNIYYSNGASVKKIQYDGTLLSSLVLSNPVSLSIVQYADKMSEFVTEPPQSDKGLWIADKGSGRVIKTDHNLNIILQIDGVLNPSCIVADVDGGCYVADDYSENLIKIDINGNILAVKSYSSFSLPIEQDIGVEEMKTFQKNTSPVQNKVWVLSRNRIYLLRYSSGVITEEYVINPYDNISSSSSTDGIEPNFIGSIDLDRYTNKLYVVGGNNNMSWINRYDENGGFQSRRTNISMSFPYVVKCVQSQGSTCLYILSDSTKYVNYGDHSSSSSVSSSSSNSSSSSSSSSYIENWSSSSSSSGDTLYVTGDGSPSPNGTYTWNGSEYARTIGAYKIFYFGGAWYLMDTGQTNGWDNDVVGDLLGNYSPFSTWTGNPVVSQT